MKDIYIKIAVTFSDHRSEKSNINTVYVHVAMFGSHN